MASLTTLTYTKYTPDISVCIATFRRPQGLARLLDSLQRLSSRGDFTLEIVIVDNDAAETARPVVETVKNTYPYPLRYCVEPCQNIAHARNRAVQAACGTWIAFIDDDETAEQNWLAAYWHMLTQKPGDGYFGPVLPCLEQAAPAWMDKEMFFGRPRFPTGTRLLEKHTRTTNAFIRRSWLDTHKFDARFGLTGGSDVELFTRMSDSGAAFYWCDEAVTNEHYPPERVCLRWLLQRAFRGGMIYTCIDKIRCPRFASHVLGMMKAVGGVCIFTLMLPFDMLRGRTHGARRLMHIGVQIGHIWGLLNLTYEEYKVRDTGTTR
jgi:glycosyltransferase involved in cell wall biosynthesis